MKCPCSCHRLEELGWSEESIKGHRCCKKMEHPIITTFRFWHEEEKRMYSIAAVEYGENGVVKRLAGIYKNGSRMIIDKQLKLEDGVLIVFTGYLDKNKKEIFSGDLVKVHFISEDSPFDGERFVFWDNGFRVHGLTTHEFSDNLDMIEVVGNKYENPKQYDEFIKNFDE